MAINSAPGLGLRDSVERSLSDGSGLLGQPVIDNGAPAEWDAGRIHDPFPPVCRGRIWLYYKGSPAAHRGGENTIRAQGVAIA